MRCLPTLLLVCAASAAPRAFAQGLEVSKPFTRLEQLDQLDRRTLRNHIEVAQRYAEEVAGGKNDIYFRELRDALLQINGKSQAAGSIRTYHAARMFQPEPEPLAEFEEASAAFPASADPPQPAAGLHELPAPPLLEKDPTWQRNFLRMLSMPADVVLHTYGGVPTKSLTEPGSFFPCVAVGNADGAFRGSGVLIAPNVVLTAAHVINGGYKERIFVGHDVRKPNEGRAFEVKQDGALPHPEYQLDVITVRCGELEHRFQQVQHDVGLLILKEEVPNVTPFAIASQQACEQHREHGGVLRGVGYGLAIDVGTAFMSIGGIQTTALLPIASSDEHQYLCNADREIIAGDGRYDMCSGDSGAPLLIERGENGVRQFKVAALVSRGLPCSGACSGGGGINTLVHPYVEWIREVSAEHGAQVELP